MKNRREAVMAPPSRLELLSSAPEADALSTELRGWAQKFYHSVGKEQVKRYPTLGHARGKNYLT